MRFLSWLSVPVKTLDGLDIVTPAYLYASPAGTPGNVQLNWTEHSVIGIVGYAASYRSAAKCLLAELSQHKRTYILDFDLSACPIVFLYRQSFELFLKAIVCRAVLLNIGDTRLSEVLQRLCGEHSLVRLYEMADPVLDFLSPTFPTGLREVRERVSALASKLDQVDHDSYAFRFPIASAPRQLLMNIFAFGEHVEAVLLSLNEICLGYLQRDSLQGDGKMRRALAPILN